MSASQLTFTPSFFRGVAQPPTRKALTWTESWDAMVNLVVGWSPPRWRDVLWWHSHCLSLLFPVQSQLDAVHVFSIVFHLFSYHCCYLPQLWSFSCASSCVFRGRHILCAGENIVNQNKRRLRATAATAGRSALIPSKDRKDLGWILDNLIFHNISFWWYNFHLIGIYQIKGGKVCVDSGINEPLFAYG